MDKHGFHLGYMVKTSTIAKEIPGIASKFKKGTLGGMQGALIGGVLAPTAAYISGDDQSDINRAALMGVMGGGVAGVSNEFAAPFFTKPGWQNRVKGSSLRYIPGFATAIGARKISQKLDDIRHRKNKEKRDAAALASQSKGEEVPQKRKYHRRSLYGKILGVD